MSSCRAAKLRGSGWVVMSAYGNADVLGCELTKDGLRVNIRVNIRVNFRVNIRVNFRVNFENGGKENSENKKIEKKK